MGDNAYYKPSTYGPPNDPRLKKVTADRLIGIEDVGEVLGIDRAAVDQIRIRDARGRKQTVPLPEPVLPRHGGPKTSPMWDRNEIITWGNNNGRLVDGVPKRQVAAQRAAAES